MKSSSPNKESKLQKENSALKALLRALKSENLQLQRKIARLEAKHLSDLNRIKALEQLKDPHGDIAHGEYVRSLTHKQLEDEIQKLLAKRPELEEAIQLLELKKGQESPAKIPKP